MTAPADVPEPRALLGSALVLYGLLAAAALGWLWLRERTGALPEQAVGPHGPWLGAAAGLVVGLLGARLLGWASPRVARVQAVEAVAKRAFAASGDTAVAAFVVAGTVAEELFFRLALPDAAGWPAAVAVAAALNSSIAGWRWLPVALLQALALALLVRQGFGLLASASANAVMNYLNLRRIQCG